MQRVGFGLEHRQLLGAVRLDEIVARAVACAEGLMNIATADRAQGRRGEGLTGGGADCLGDGGSKRHVRSSLEAIQAKRAPRGAS